MALAVSAGDLLLRLAAFMELALGRLAKCLEGEPAVSCAARGGLSFKDEELEGAGHSCLGTCVSNTGYGSPQVALFLACADLGAKNFGRVFCRERDSFSGLVHALAALTLCCFLPLRPVVQLSCAAGPEAGLPAGQGLLPGGGPASGHTASGC